MVTELWGPWVSMPTVWRMGTTLVPKVLLAMSTWGSTTVLDTTTPGPPVGRAGDCALSHTWLSRIWPYSPTLSGRVVTATPRSPLRRSVLPVMVQRLQKSIRMPELPLPTTWLSTTRTPPRLWVMFTPCPPLPLIVLPFTSTLQRSLGPVSGRVMLTPRPRFNAIVELRMVTSTVASDPLGWNRMPCSLPPIVQPSMSTSSMASVSMLGSKSIPAPVSSLYVPRNDELRIRSPRTDTTMSAWRWLFSDTTSSRTTSSQILPAGRLQRSPAMLLLM